MEDIQDVHFVELENSKYLKPIRMKYTQAGRDEMKHNFLKCCVVFTRWLPLIFTITNHCKKDWNGCNSSSFFSGLIWKIARYVGTKTPPISGRPSKSLGSYEEPQQCCHRDLQDGYKEVRSNHTSRSQLLQRFVFVRQFRPAIYMARAEEAGTPVTVGTRLRIAGSLFSYDEREAIYPH